MVKNLQINPDHYDKKTPENLNNNFNKKQLLNPVYKNPHPDYFVSSKIRQHILSDPKITANQNIKILDSNLHINTYLKILNLQLSFIINNQLLDPKTKNKQNYKFIFEINLVNYRQEEGVFENLDQDLFLSIKKIAQLIYEHVPQKNLLHISDFELSHSVLKEIMNKNQDQFLNYITAIISIINAKGKYQKIELKAGGYEKKLKQEKSHIPCFKFEKQDVKIKLQIENPFILTRDEEALPRKNRSFFNFFKNFLVKIIPDHNNIKMSGADNNSQQNSSINDPLTFSIKRQLSGLAHGDYSFLTTPNLILSLSIIFVLVTILILLITMLI